MFLVRGGLTVQLKRELTVSEVRGELSVLGER